MGLKKQITRFIESFIKRREHSKVLIEGVPSPRHWALWPPEEPMLEAQSSGKKKRIGEGWASWLHPMQVLNSSGEIPKMCLLFLGREIQWLWPTVHRSLVVLYACLKLKSFQMPLVLQQNCFVFSHNTALCARGKCVPSPLVDTPDKKL